MERNSKPQKTLCYAFDPGLIRMFPYFLTAGKKGSALDELYIAVSAKIPTLSIIIPEECFRKHLGVGQAFGVDFKMLPEVLPCHIGVATVLLITVSC